MSLRCEVPVTEDFHAVGFYDKTVCKIFKAAAAAAVGEEDPSRTRRSEFEVRAHIEELLQAEQQRMQARHLQELAKQRQAAENVERLRKVRMGLLQREAGKENDDRNRDQTKDAKHGDAESQLQEREQVLASRESKIAETTRENDQKESDLDMRKLRLDQESTRLEAEKVMLEQSQQELPTLASAQAQLESVRQENKALEAARREGLEKERNLTEQHKAQQGLIETARLETAEATVQARKASELQLTLDARHEELTSSERGLASKEAELASFERSLVERESAAEGLRKELSSRECSVAERASAAAELGKDLGSREGRLKEAERSVKAERTRLADEATDLAAERTRHLSEQAAPHVEKAEKSAEALVADRAKVMDKANQVASAEKACSAREATCSDREAAVRLLEQQAIQERQGMMANQDANEDVERLRSSLHAQEEESNELRLRLQSSIEEVAGVRQAQEDNVKTFEEAQVTLQRRVGELSQQLEAKQEENARIARDYREQERRLADKRAQTRSNLVQQENRAKFDHLVTRASADGTSSASASGEARSARQPSRKSEPSDNFGRDAEFHDAHSNTKRSRLTARKNVPGAGSSEFLTPNITPAAFGDDKAGSKRARASAPGQWNGTWGRDEAPGPAAETDSQPSSSFSQGLVAHARNLFFK